MKSERFNLEFKSMIEGDFVNSNVLTAVKQAGKTALEVRDRGLVAKQKASKEDLVTQGDLLVTQQLKSSLTVLFGDIVFMDEETSETHGLNLQTDKTIAVVDPIDGTGNYYESYMNSQRPESEQKAGTENWGLSVGFVKNGEVVGGVIYQPELDRIYYTERGKGAYLDHKRLHVNETAQVTDSQPYFDFPYPHDKVEYDQTTRLLSLLESQLHTKKPVKLGSQVIEIMQVAEGNADFFFCLKTKPWDVAAAVSIISESGGITTNKYGTPYRLFEENIVFKNATIDLTQFYESVENAA